MDTTKLDEALQGVELTPVAEAPKLKPLVASPKAAALPITGDGTPKKLPPRIMGIETAEGGLEIGEPSAIPGVEARVIRKAQKQSGPVNPNGTVVVRAPKVQPKLHQLTQQQRMILSSRSKRTI